MWGRKTVAVIIPISGKRSLVDVVRNFDSTGYVDEIVLVGKVDPASMQIRKLKNRARFFFQRKNGVGNSLKEAVSHMKSDLIIVGEESGLFSGKDILKLLAYSDDFEMVFGSRTHVPLVEKGSGMTFARRFVDDIFGKLVSLLFLSSPLTDVGCTLRLSSKNAWIKIASKCRSNGEIFLTEWLLWAVAKKISFIEIPVHYSSVKSLQSKNNFLIYSARALVVLFYIFRVRLQKFIG